MKGPITFSKVSADKVTIANGGQEFSLPASASVASKGGATIEITAPGFSLAMLAADVWVPLQYAQYGSTGSALTFNTYSKTGMVANAQSWYDKAALAGKVTVTIVGQNAASKTNTTAVTLIVTD
jgi:hypothetical protein